VVPAPLGTVIATLPSGFLSVYVGPTRYFYYYGTFYDYNPAQARYVVVPAPMGAVVPAIPEGFMTVYIQGVRHYVVGGVYYRPVYRGDVLMYEVVPPPDNSTLSSLGLVPEYLYAYPKAGQSAAEQERDRAECHRWAVEESGFDPAAVPDPTQTAERQQFLQEYNRAFRACMEARNYTVQ
jgi:hypothetical protein